MEIEYLNEHLLPGKLGHFFILLAFVSALLASIAYARATKNREQNLESSWKAIGRYSFLVHGLSVFMVIGLIFLIMVEKYYEYAYAWEHVSDDLPMKYILSAFWEGQEGSFLLWTFWHIILGFFLMFTARKWEAPVLSMLSLVQVFIVSMILGVYLFQGTALEFKLGANPLLLLRDTMEAPIFQRANYVEMIQGSGLNPLLQNYWMTIHPPVLFLGFASVTIPFCYAIAGLWTRQHKAWLKPVLPWALFSGGILGIGILMGGAWAYEALSFGGYWAWDPVENMSLVPWIVMIAGIHLVLIAKATGHSVRSAYLFFIFSFALILYSTFLTRSGILGDTSVHAFTEMGLEWQLVAFVLFFSLFGLGLFLARVRGIKEVEEEEAFLSREFWMFIGSLVLLFSAILISFTTSAPVFNKLALYIGGAFGWIDPETFKGIRPPEDAIAHFNKYQLWIAVFVSMLSGFAVFMRYKEKKKDRFQNYLVKHLLISGIIALVLTIITAISFDKLNAWQYILLYWAATFSVLANATYLVTVAKGNIKLAGSAVSHLGFGLMILGIIFSGLGERAISKSNFMSGLEKIEGFTAEDNSKNIILPLGAPVDMANYRVTYLSDSTKGFTRKFNIQYERKNAAGEVTKTFMLQPNILYNKAGDKIEASNPSTKHYFLRDIFTHVTALPLWEMEPEKFKEARDTMKFTAHELSEGDTLYTTKNFVIFKGFDQAPEREDYEPLPGDLSVAARMEVHTLGSDSTWLAKPLYVIRDDFGIGLEDEVAELGLVFKFAKIDGQKKTITMEVGETLAKRRYIILQAIEFPGINLFWLGTCMMMLGLLFSAWQRRNRWKKSS